MRVSLGLLVAMLASLAASAPASAQTSGNESFSGVIVVSNATGERQLLSSSVVAKGVFTGAGKIVEIPSLPGGSRQRRARRSRLRQRHDAPCEHGRGLLVLAEPAQVFAHGHDRADGTDHRRHWAVCYREWDVHRIGRRAGRAPAQPGSQLCARPVPGARGGQALGNGNTIVLTCVSHGPTEQPRNSATISSPLLHFHVVVSRRRLKSPRRRGRGSMVRSEPTHGGHGYSVLLEELPLSQHQSRVWNRRVIDCGAAQRAHALAVKSATEPTTSISTSFSSDVSPRSSPRSSSSAFEKIPFLL